jgi:hypothetical protein
MRLAIATPPTATAVATTTSGSAVVTVPDVTLLAGAIGVTGTGIPPGTLVYSVDSATQLTLTAQATASGTPTLTFTLEPVTLAEAKLHLRVDIDDDQSLIASLITAARIMCEGQVARSFLATTWDLYLDHFLHRAGTRGSGGLSGFGWTGAGYTAGMPWMISKFPDSPEIVLPRGAMTTVSYVKYYDRDGVQQTVDTSVYTVSPGAPGRISTSSCQFWPCAQHRLDAINVRFVAGYGATADSVPANVKAAIKLLIGHYYEHREEVSDLQTFQVPSAVTALLSPEDWGAYQ